ncbi:MAG: alpha/beta fold hydrolase [Terracidiphilus sp.]
MQNRMVRAFTLVALAVAALAPPSRAQSQLVGEWLGTLKTGDTQVHVAWHVAAARDGSVTSTIDNLDQRIYGLPVSSMTLNDNALTLTLDTVRVLDGDTINIRGTFTGTINAGATEIHGSWVQGQPLELDLKRVTLQAALNAVAQSQLVGDWKGTLSAGGVELRLVLHVTAATDGSLTATLDSVDQGAYGIPVTTVTLKDSKFSLVVDAVHGTYEGTLNKDASEIDGTWSQGVPLQLNLRRATAAEAAPPTDIDGTWMGTLTAGAIQLRIVFKIANTADGLTARMQSPDQSPAWVPASAVKREGATLTVEIKGIGATFAGKISADLNSIGGTFTQMGNDLPLVLERVKDESVLERPRPQNPVKPYPYREEEVTYTNKTAGNTLAATLTLPPGKGPFPAVLLIAGSGPHDRDESLMGHKPFLVLADSLTRRGIVVLRADKRGIGESTGNLATATTADFADDAQAGVEYLKTRTEVDPYRIGLIGQSEGGVIAPMLAVRDRDVAFVVMMAGAGLPGDQIIEAQQRLIEEAAGENKDRVEQDAERERELVAMVEKEMDPAALDTELRALLASSMPDTQAGSQIKLAESPWFRYFLTYDPAVALRKLTCPVLVLNGEKDLQVPPALNLPAIRKALDEAGNKHYEIDELPGLNHLFQTAKTGLPTEYAQIDETISPAVLDMIANWILRQ